MAWKKIVLAPLAVFRSPFLYALLALVLGLAMVIGGVVILAGPGWGFVTAGAFAILLALWILTGVARSGG